MKRLRIGQLVEIVGRHGIFKVVRMRGGGLADLELMSGAHFIEESVAISSIKEYKEEPIVDGSGRI